MNMPPAKTSKTSKKSAKSVKSVAQAAVADVTKGAPAVKKVVASKMGRFAQETRVPLPGSEKTALTPQAVPGVGSAAAPSRGRGSKVTVSVIVKRKAPLPAAASGIRLTRAQFNTQHGPEQGALKLVKAFAAEFGLSYEAPMTGHRTAHLTGSEAAMAKAFRISFSKATVEGVTYRTREGAVLLPESLIGQVDAVLGLDNRPQALAHFRVRKAAAGANVSYSPAQVAELYGLKAGASAAGQTIAILELGGGYRTADLSAYFKGLGLPVPKVSAVSVDKGKNTPGTANGADGEVMLDLEVCGSVAVGAKLVVYFAPNTDQGFIDAIATAVHDATNKPSVLSISWGGPESTWTGQSLTALDEACQAAAALGVTITVAAGDNGSTDGVKGTVNHVDFPASSPHVLACGGTKLLANGTAIASEVVWNETAANEGATGGGVSAVFALPSWQAAAGVPKGAAPGGRGVPDIAGDADPATGYNVRVDGQESVIGGTSAVAPLWAGLIAVSNAANKVTAGFVNPVLYANAKALRDITTGNNGAFAAKAGWDACTGLGSPNVPAVFAALAGNK